MSDINYSVGGLFLATKRFSMSEISVGKEVLSYCTKCKLVLAHIIVSMKNHSNIGKVLCSTCKSTHAYKDPSAVKTKGAKKAAANSGGHKSSENSIADLWLSAVNNTTSKSKNYTIKDKFLLGDIIDHPSFGPGVVDKIIDNDKIQVIFRHDIKTLVHGKK
jgi:hypothetical protein